MVTVKTTGPRIQTVDSASGPRVDPILDIVVEMLDTEGYEAVQLREVARRARVSLATIYKRYPTRDELIVAALEGWMDANRYARLPSLIEDLPGGSIYVDLMHVMRTIFEPWERHPLMLRSYFQARSGPGENASSSAVSMPSSRSPKPFWPKPIRVRQRPRAHPARRRVRVSHAIRSGRDRRHRDRARHRAHGVLADCGAGLSGFCALTESGAVSASPSTDRRRLCIPGSSWPPKGR